MKQHHDASLMTKSLRALHTNGQVPEQCICLVLSTYPSLKARLLLRSSQEIQVDHFREKAVKNYFDSISDLRSP